ncbi:sialic acid-binding Ig-like lectin 12 [Talpa occidentalis]|uniref:sialic acid-binding Ig-like lectin 12 n=1 Tax=Talpa occidentalis TaxID=50954 RepID=UPI0023FA01C2|nr:sialic acid-binding Ig-like lectin 12 [Talpa occidentalis]
MPRSLTLPVMLPQLLLPLLWAAHVVQKETRGRFHLLGDPGTYSCSLDIRDARREDTGTYYFRVETQSYVLYEFMNHQLSVLVTALTHRPDIYLQGPLQSGRPRKITCVVPWACKRGTRPTFSWMGVGLTATGTNSPVLTLSPGPQHHGSNLTCRVTFPAVNVSTETTVRRSVAYAPQNLTIQVIREEGSEPEALGNGSSFPVQEGQSLRLACVVHSSPPAMLSWFQGTLSVKSSPSLNLGPQGARTWVVLGAIGGAGVSALLVLCLVFFIVRSCKKKGMEAAASRLGPQAAGRTPGGHKGRPWADSPLHTRGPAATPSEEEQELHYANLGLPKANPRAFLVQEASEYAQIKGAALS